MQRARASGFWSDTAALHWLCLCLLAAVSACGSPPATTTAVPTATSPPAPTATAVAPAKPAANRTVATKPAVASNPAAATKPTAAAKPAAADSGGSCLVGKWTVTNVSITSASGTQSGGAGAVWTISSTGDLKEELSGSKPILGATGGGVQLGGGLSATIQLPADANATSGPWVANNVDSSLQTTSVVGPNGQVLTTISGGKVVGANGQVIATVGPSNAVMTSGNWTCSGDTLTVQFTSATPNGGSGQEAVTLTRASL